MRERQTTPNERRRIHGALPERQATTIAIQQILDELADEWSKALEVLDEMDLRLSLLEAKAA